MDKSIVALVPVDTYEQAAVDEAVRKGVELLGGIGAFVKPEEKILLKPNLLSGALPRKAITVHQGLFAKKQTEKERFSSGRCPGPGQRFFRRPGRARMCFRFRSAPGR